MEKRCGRCRETKSVELFSRRATTRDGLYSWCKSCAAEQKRNSPIQAESARRRASARFIEKREDVRAYRKRQYHADSAENSRRASEWYRENRERAEQTRRAWRKRNWQRVLEINQNRRARVLGQFVEDVDRSEVLARAGGLCGICGEAVDPTLFDIDHIVPISRGGEHSYANTQPSHPPCNIAKGARLLGSLRDGHLVRRISENP